MNRKHNIKKEKEKKTQRAKKAEISHLVRESRRRPSAGGEETDDRLSQLIGLAAHVFYNLQIDDFLSNN